MMCSELHCVPQVLHQGISRAEAFLRCDRRRGAPYGSHLRPLLRPATVERRSGPGHHHTHMGRLLETSGASARPRPVFLMRWWGRRRFEGSEAIASGSPDTLCVMRHLSLLQLSLRFPTQRYREMTGRDRCAVCLAELARSRLTSVHRRVSQRCDDKEAGAEVMSASAPVWPISAPDSQIPRRKNGQEGKETGI